jgi:hypothetical protein
MSRMRCFRCHCCGADFDSKKPQDPERDTGYGTCDACHEQVAQSWLKHGVEPRITTIEAMRKRFARYA